MSYLEWIFRNEISSFGLNDPKPKTWPQALTSILGSKPSSLSLEPDPLVWGPPGLKTPSLGSPSWGSPFLTWCLCSYQDLISKSSSKDLLPSTARFHPIKYIKNALDSFSFWSLHRIIDNFYFNPSGPDLIFYTYPPRGGEKSPPLVKWCFATEKPHFSSFGEIM